MMITETGKNLSVLIVTETGKDWQTFGTWYSFYKNLPDAQVSIAVIKNGDTPFQLYQWAKRLDLPIRFIAPFSEDPVLDKLDAINKMKKILQPKILVVDPLVMATETLEPKITDRLNQGTNLFESNLWVLHEPDVDELINKYALDEEDMLSEGTLCVDANDTEDLFCLVSYKKGCGKWIDTSKGCPFSNAAGLTSAKMTANENRVIELWKNMCSLYSALS